MSAQRPLWGIDVSNHQGNVGWSRVADEGFSFAIAKATEGTYYRDGTYQRNQRQAAAAGLVPGAYHFLTSEDISTQLELFLDHTGSLKGRIVAVDVEAVHWPGGIDASPSTTDVWNFVHGLRDHLPEHHPILIYSAYWYWGGRLGNPDVGSLVDKKNCQLWVARYASTKRGYASELYRDVPRTWWSGSNPPSFGNRAPAMLQFTDRALVGGQRLDANAFPGSAEDLAALAGSVQSRTQDYYVQARSEGHTRERAEELAAASRTAGWTAKVGKA